MIYKRGARGAKPLLQILPLPLSKGKGIQGMGFKINIQWGEVNEIGDQRTGREGEVSQGSFP